MIDFTTLMGSIATNGDICTVTATDDWLQGRTIYGGLAAAFCLESVSRQFGDLPPLRSAQFSFVGPATGSLTIRPAILRKGKSTTFVGAELMGDAGLATRATFCFGAERQSAVEYGKLAAPDVPDPDACPNFFRKLPGLNFAQHFDGRLAAGSFPFSGADDPTIALWMRHQDDAEPNSTAALVALTDAPPPAALLLFKDFGPISTMTWSIDLLTDKLETTNGWWLIRTQAESVLHGYSSQGTVVFNAARQPVLVSRQNVAVFM
ncbi:acyl-CoA thioesterase [Nitrobacteraceae bacterium AZCC 1564]